MENRPANFRCRSSPCLSLGEACERAGEDDDGRRCPLCPLRELCLDHSRWLVRQTLWPLWRHQGCA
jgi:hypothetical protein